MVASSPVSIPIPAWFVMVAIGLILITLFERQIVRRLRGPKRRSASPQRRPPR